MSPNGEYRSAKHEGTPVRPPGRWRAWRRVAGVAVALLIGAGAAWQRGPDVAGLLALRRATPSQSAALAAATLAEVCTTPAQLPRRRPVAPRPVHDPFAPGPVNLN